MITKPIFYVKPLEFESNEELFSATSKLSLIKCLAELKRDLFFFDKIAFPNLNGKLNELYDLVDNSSANYVFNELLDLIEEDYVHDFDLINNKILINGAFANTAYTFAEKEYKKAFMEIQINSIPLIPLFGTNYIKIMNENEYLQCEYLQYVLDHFNRNIKTLSSIKPSTVKKNYDSSLNMILYTIVINKINSPVDNIYSKDIMNYKSNSTSNIYPLIEWINQFLFEEKLINSLKQELNHIHEELNRAIPLNLIKNNNSSLQIFIQVSFAMEELIDLKLKDLFKDITGETFIFFKQVIPISNILYEDSNKILACKFI